MALPATPRALPVEIIALGSPSLPPAQDIAPLVASVGDAMIIGLGEATHGTREFTTSRAALVLELARQNRLAAVALEVSYADCIALNEYVLFGTGDATSAVAAMGVWPWRTQEVRELAQAHAVRQAGVPNGLIDLRRDPNATSFRAREWSVRQVEAVFDPAQELDAYASDRWSNLFDVIVYFEHTRALTPIAPAGR